MKYQNLCKTLIRSRFHGMHWCAHKTATLTSIQQTVPLVLWVSQVKNPVIISIVGISLQSATSSKGIYNRCGPRKNNLTHTDFDPIVEFKIFSRGFRTIFNMFIVQKCRCSLWSSNPIFISSSNYIQVFDSYPLIKV